MIHRGLADAVLLIHLGFILFVVLGGFLVVRWPRLAWLHVPAVLWGALIEFTGGVCPLTPLEVSLRQRGGEAGYTGGFIEHYVTQLVYPGGLTRPVQAALGAVALLINGVVYWRVVARAWARRRGAGAGGT